MGENWASHLPHEGAGRPKDSKNGVRRPGVKGGTAQRKRGAAEKREDPLFIPGSNQPAQKPPHWADIDKIAEGARRIHLALHEARRVDQIEGVIDRMLEDALAGNYKAGELMLSYFGGKPVAYVARGQTGGGGLSGDAVAAMAAQVTEKMRADGLRVISREVGA